MARIACEDQFRFGFSSLSRTSSRKGTNMEFTQNRTIQVIALLLLLAAISQPIYTALYLHAPEVDRRFLWAFEALIFVVMAAFAGSALSMAKRYTLGFSAIAFSAVLNVVQVGIGLTQFGPFRAATESYPELSGAAYSVVALSFFLYNAAKILLGLAALVFGMACLKDGRKVLGGLTALAGFVAISANSLVMMFGLKSFMPSPVAGGSGVAATLLLAVCLFMLSRKDQD